MNNSDLSLEFLKKCQKCRESGVNGEMAILAALHDLADYKDQHPREGLWDSEKVIKWLQDNADSYTWYNEFEGESGMTDDFIEDLQKAMED